MDGEEESDGVCPDCGGLGEITTMERVYPDAGSPMAPIGTQKCHCQIKEEDIDYQD